MVTSRILVVEDERIVAKDLKACLQSLGYAVPALAASGEEAIKKAAEVCPDLVLMDICLEGDMNGVEAAEQIYTRFNIPIIYLTAHSDKSTLQWAKAVGPFGYIVKPFEEQDLLTTIETALHRYQLEKKLTESEQWWATTLRSVGDAVIATDAKGCVKFLNPVAEALTGWKQDDAFGRDVTEVLSIINAQTRARIKNPITRVLQEGVVVSLKDDAILISKNKIEIPIEDSAAPIKDDQGNLTGVVVVFRDISERKQAESVLRQANEKLTAMEQKQLKEALGRSQDRWQAIIDTEPECVMVVAPDGVLLEMNAAGLAMIEAQSADSVIGESVYSLIAREYREAFQVLNESVCQGNKGSLEFEIIGLRGTRRWMETHAVPLANELDGTRVQFAIARDITERKRAESLLVGQKRVLEMIATGASLPNVLESLIQIVEEQSSGMLCSILLLDQNGRNLVTSADPSLPANYNRAIDSLAIGPSVGSCCTATYLGKPVIVSDIASDPLWKDFRDLALEHGVRACWSTPIFSTKGNILGTFAMYYLQPASPNAHDLQLIEIAAHIAGIAIERNQVDEALRQSEQAAIAQVEELEKLNRLKDEFLSTVSHELRTPVTNMKMALEMLTLCLKPKAAGFDAMGAVSSKIDRYLEVLQDECKREISLINDLLDLQRLDAGVEPLELETICLETWLRQVAEPFQERARNQNQTFQLELPQMLPPLVSNQSSLERILAELLNNACKYTSRGEGITLKAFIESSTIQLQVINSGVEIPNLELPRIFDKFYRIPSTDPWKQGGTGLGLTLVKKLTEHLGGTIWVRSEHGSTCFTVSLPIQGQLRSNLIGNGRVGTNGI